MDPTTSVAILEMFFGHLSFTTIAIGVGTLYHIFIVKPRMKSIIKDVDSKVERLEVELMIQEKWENGIKAFDDKIEKKFNDVSSSIKMLSDNLFKVISSNGISSQR